MSFEHIQDRAILAHHTGVGLTYVRVVRVPRNLHAKARVLVEETGVRREVLAERLLDAATARASASPPPEDFHSSEEE